jgi:hypothetical protein
MHGEALMVEFRLSDVKETKVREYCLRFLFGGICTAAAGLIAKRYGAGIGGLFLAFPAIFPAGVSLIQAHEKEKKAKMGADGTRRGRLAASIDAAGAALGCCGLLAFAFVCWKALPSHNSAVVIALACMLWLIVAIALWEVRKRRVFGHRITCRLGR